MEIAPHKTSFHLNNFGQSGQTGRIWERGNFAQFISIMLCRASESEKRQSSFDLIIPGNLSVPRVRPTIMTSLGYPHALFKVWSEPGRIRRRKKLPLTLKCNFHDMNSFSTTFLANEGNTPLENKTSIGHCLLLLIELVSVFCSD